MNTLYSRLFVTLILFLVCNGVFGQIPVGGTQLNASTGTTWQKIGVGTLTQVSVSGQPFATALRLTVGANVNNTWDSQIKFPAVAGIEANDIVLVAFYARTISAAVETGEGGLNVIIEHNVTYAKDLSHKVNIGQEWKQYFAPVKCVSNWPTAQISYLFHTGFPSQTIEIADVRFINYKQTRTLEEMPVTEITYGGQDEDADWRSPAAERIDQIRKGIADIYVYDESGQVLENAEVSIEMVRHQFGFGSAIPASRFLTNTTFRNKVYELFNEVVFENDLKWPNFNPNSTLNLRRSLDSLDKHNIAVRGHTIMWPAWRWLPTSLRTFENDLVALRLQIDKHIDEVTQFAKGRLIDWDVINEPYSEKDIMAILGNEVMADWFKRTRQNDRGVKRYLNDYGILSGGGINKVKQDSYYNLVKYIDDLGGGVDGIGLQGHFGGDLTSIPKIYSILDRFAELGKDIKITEHDINITQRKVQADFTRDFMTIVFSHPAVKSLLFWGFWESSHWMPNAAMYNTDWSIRPHGEMYIDMVFNQWWTKLTHGMTDDQGRVSLEGFLGTYSYTVKSGDTERTGTFTLDHSKQSELPNEIIISLDKAIPVQVSITTAIPPVLCEGEHITLNAPSGEGLAYTWYRDSVLLEETSDKLETGVAGSYIVNVSKGAVELTSPPFEVTVNPFPEAKITVDGDLSFCPGGKVTFHANTSKELTYTWKRGDAIIHGSVPSINANTAGSYTLTTNAKGCSTTSEPVQVQVYAQNDPACTTGINDPADLFRVYPNPFQGSFTLETSSLHGGMIHAELFNVAGALVYSAEINPTALKTIIPVSTPGFYLLKVSDADGTRTVKLVGGVAR